MGIPNGLAGTRATLAIMSNLIRKYKVDPVIRELSVKLVRHLPNHKYGRQAGVIHKWIQNNISYVRDVAGVETIQTPHKTLELGAGDCDDMTTLCAVMLESIGLKTKLVAVGFKNNALSHVLPMVLIGRKWYWLECTRPLLMGEAPKNITSYMEYHNR